MTACMEAGGQVGIAAGDGQYVFSHDFTGDGAAELLLTEGTFPCTGRSELFRPGGNARVEVWLADGSLVFADRLAAHRVLEGRPPRLEITRDAADCGASGPCVAELRWNAGEGRFDEVGTASGGGVRPAVIAQAPAAPAKAVPPAGRASRDAPAAAPAVSAEAPAAASPLPVAPAARGEFLARCRGDILAGNPQAEGWVDEHCREAWGRVDAAGPLADMLLAAAPVSAGDRPAAAALKARLRDVRWAAKPAPRSAASGRLGKVDVLLEGRPTATAISLGWQAVGEPVPFDVPEALRARGAEVTALGCFHFGAGEVNRAFRVEAPGRAPFALETYTREAPFANANASLGLTLDLTGKLPTAASLRAAHRDPPWQDPCPH